MQQQMQFDNTETRNEQGAKIIAVGVGGGGSNMIAHLINTGVHQAITLIAANTDIQHLSNSPAKHKIKLGEKLTKGLGAGMVPEVGAQSAQESYDTILQHLSGADIVFVSAGLGGGTGTGAAPIIAQAAQEAGALTIAVVTKPFMMEGNKRLKIAEEGLKELRKHCDGIVVVPNDKLLTIINRNSGIKESFKEVDSILARAVNGISNVILKHGETDINTDFADLKTVMQNKGLALMGIGEAQGEDAATEATKKLFMSEDELKKAGVELTSDGNTLTMHIGDKTAQIMKNSNIIIVNGEKKTLDGVVVYNESKWYFPSQVLDILK